MSSQNTAVYLHDFSNSGRPQSGFSLLELMVVVVIISILTAVALPAYNSYIARGKIPDATATLSQLRNQLELYYQDNRSYGGTSERCGSSTSPIPSTTTNSNDSYFTFSCSGTDQTYLLTATGKNSMVGYTFTVDQQNNKQTTAFPGVSGTKSCWLLKVGDC